MSDIKTSYEEITKPVSSINWEKAGLDAYQAYDNNPAFLTPNNINQILSCITNHKDVLCAVIPQVNSCVRTVNNKYPVNGNINIDKTISVTDINNCAGSIKIAYNDIVIPATKLEENTYMLNIKSANTISAVNNIVDGYINLKKDETTNWPNNFNQETNTYNIIISATYNTISDIEGNFKFYYGTSLLVPTDITAVNDNIKTYKITIPSATGGTASEVSVSSINDNTGKFLFMSDENTRYPVTKNGDYNVLTIPSATKHNSTPIGTIISWYGKADPDFIALKCPGWHLCDGTKIDTTYTELIELVGSNYPNLIDGKYIQYGSEVDITSTAAGLPNISGLTYTTYYVIRPDHFCDGVFKNSKHSDGSLYNEQTPYYDETGNMGYLSFNAASGQINKDGTLVTDPDKVIYGKSDTVTPYHMTLLPLIKCTNN